MTLQLTDPLYHIKALSETESRQRLMTEFEKKASQGRYIAMTCDAPWLSGGFVCERLYWDSDHFGKSMARLHVLPEKSSQFPCRRDQLRDVLARIDSAGVEHMTCSVMAFDLDSLNLLIEFGFRVADQQVSFTLETRNMARIEKRVPYKSRATEARDHDAIVDLASTLRFPSRFYSDATLSESSVGAMYGLWIDKTLNTATQDRVAQVVTSDGSVIAFGGASILEYPREHGSVRVCSRALAGALPGYAGATLSVVKGMALEARTKSDVIENIVSLHNKSSVRGLEYLGFRYAYSTIVLSRSPD
jgi:hypothetical protein